MAPDSPHHHVGTPGDAPKHLPEWETSALDYLDDRLPPEDRARVDAHLATCADCRRDLDDQRAMHGVLSGIAQATPPPGLAEAVLAQVLAKAAPVGTTSSDDAPSDELTAPAHTLPRPWRGSFVSRLLRPRVWMPAAAAVLLAAVLLSQFQPTTGDRAALQSAKDAGGREITTTAGDAATAAPEAGAEAQTDQSTAAAMTPPSTLAAGTATTETTPPAGDPSVTSGLYGAADTPVGRGSPLLDPAAAASGSLWIEVGSAGASTSADAAWTGRMLASLVGAVRADLPPGTTVPAPTTPLYVTSAARGAVAGLLARMAEAGLDPRFTFAPPTLDAAVGAVAAAGVFPAGSAVGNRVSATPPVGVKPGNALLLVNVAD